MQSPTDHRDDRPWRFEQTLKDYAIEEWINHYVHRPLAFALIIRPIGWLPARLRPHPNHLTFCSGGVGICSGVAAYQAVDGSLWWLAVASLLLFIAVLFDCSDGMLARLSKLSSRFGMLLDGVVDAVVGAAFWAGMCLATMPESLGAWGWPVGVLILLSVVGHCALYDHFRNRFVQVANPPDASAALENKEDVDGSPVSLVESAYTFFYVKPSRLLVGAGPTDRRPDVSPEFGRATLTGPMRVASFLGLGTQLWAMYTATLFGVWSRTLPFLIAFGLVVVGLNLWTLVTIIAWRRAEATLTARAQSHPYSPQEPQ